MTEHMSSQPAHVVSIPGVPDDAPRSPDGFYWWDGAEWQLIPATTVEPEPDADPFETFDPWGSGFGDDISRGDPVLRTRALSAEPLRASAVDSWSWALAVAPVLAVAGAFFHPVAALVAYGLVAVASALAVHLDVKTLQSLSYVSEDFGSKAPLMALLGTPVAVPIYLHRRMKALEEDSSKVMTWYVAAGTAIVFAVLGLTSASGSLFGELLGPEEVAPASPADWITGIPVDENGNLILPEGVTMDPGGVVQ